MIAGTVQTGGSTANGHGVRPLRRLTALLLLLNLALAGATASGQDRAAEAPIGTQPSTDSAPAAGSAPPAGSSPPDSAQVNEPADSPQPGTAADPIVATPQITPPPITQQPYAVRVELSWNADSQLPTPRMARLLPDVRDALRKIYGDMWDCDVAATSWLLPADSARLDRVQAAELKDRYSEETAQKVMLVTIESVSGAWHVNCREYDTRVRELSPSRERVVADERAIAAAAAVLMRDSFRPVLFLAHAARGTDEVELLLQAGEIPPPDPTAAQIGARDVLQPYLRHMERRNPTRVRQLQRLDLTWVRVTKFDEKLSTTSEAADIADAGSSSSGSRDEDVTVPNMNADEHLEYLDRGRVSGVVLSHGLSQFGRRGRSVQQLALRLRPMAERSRVRLVLNQAVDRPLVAYRVDKVGKFRYQDAHEENMRQLTTDRRGEIELEVDPDHPTFWLYVYSGSLLLARVPYAPGLIAAETIRLPDDSIRLGVEGELYLLRDQIVDVAAQRAVLNRIAEKAAADRDPGQLAAAVRDLLDLPGKREFDAILNTIRVPAAARARELRNRAAERSVDKLCNAMSKSVDAFFSGPKHLKELEKLQKLQDLAGAAVPPAPGNSP